MALTVEEVDRRLAQYGFERLGEYVNNHTKMKVRCSCGDERYAFPFSLFKGVKCMACKNTKPKKNNEILIYEDDWLLIDISTETNQGCAMKIDRSFWEWFVKQKKYGRVCAMKKDDGKIMATVWNGEEMIYLHKLVRPEFKKVDHRIRRTHNFIDNRRSNLRDGSGSKNQLNTGANSNNQLGFKGVSPAKNGTYCARVRLKGKDVYYKIFKDLNQAKEAVVKARLQHHGYEYLSSEDKQFLRDKEILV